MGWTDDERMALHLLNTVWHLTEDNIARIFPALFPSSEIKPDKNSKGWLVKLRDEYRPRFKTGRSARWKVIDRPWMIPRGNGVVDYNNTPYTNQEVREFQRLEQGIVRVARNLNIKLTEKDAANRPATLGGTFRPFTAEDRRKVDRDFAKRTEPAPRLSSAIPSPATTTSLSTRRSREAAAALSVDPAISTFPLQTGPAATFSFRPLPTLNMEATRNPVATKSNLEDSSGDIIARQNPGAGKRVPGKTFTSNGPFKTPGRRYTPSLNAELDTDHEVSMDEMSTPRSAASSRAARPRKRNATSNLGEEEDARFIEKENSVSAPPSALPTTITVPTTIPRSTAKPARVVKHSQLTQLRRLIYDEKLVGAIPMVHSRNVVWDTRNRKAVFEQHYTDEKYTYSGAFIDQDTQTYKQGGVVINLALGGSARPVMVCSRGFCGGCFGSRTADTSATRPDRAKSNAPMPVPIFHRKDLKQKDGQALLVFDTKDAVREQLSTPAGMTNEKIIVYEDVVVGYAIREVKVCAVGGCAVCR